MPKRVLTILLMGLLGLAAIGVHVPPASPILEKERRMVARFPESPSSISSRKLKKYFKGIDQYYADNFPLRGALLDIVSHLGFGDAVNTEKCFQGKDDWLFLGNSYARCIDKLTGRIVLSAAETQRQAARYSAARDAAVRAGVPFVMLVGPDKATIYPDKLPDIVRPAQHRYAEPLLDALRAGGIAVYDPTDMLREARQQHLLYFRTDTHWNARGADIAFEGLRQLAGWPELPRHDFAAISTAPGDLIDIGGFASFPLHDDDTFAVQWHAPMATVERNGVVHTPGASSAYTVWVFGDSFTDALRPFIEAQFQTVKYFRHKQYTTVMQQAEGARPDAILWVIVERNITETWD